MIEQLKRSQAFLASVFLAYLVCAVFYPVLQFDFLYIDVRDQIVENPHIQGLTLENLKYIFTTRSITSYYPVRSLTYAIDYQIWGLKPVGFKLTNGLIHLTNVLLLFWLLMRLLRNPVSGDATYERWWNTVVATFAASVFAIHPVTVEPVAWVAGREELLMVFGILGCIHFHLNARRLQDEGRQRKALFCHFGAFFFCAVACLSNAVGAVTPALLTAWDLLTLKSPKCDRAANDRPSRQTRARRARFAAPTSHEAVVDSADIIKRITLGTLPFWLLGAATILVKVLGPTTTAIGQASSTLTERIGTISTVYWLNVKTFVWPTKLAFRYPNIVTAELSTSGMMLGAGVICLTGLIFWNTRRRKMVLFGLIWYGVALAPSAQIFAHHIHRADRLLYLPLAGLMIAVAAGLAPLRGIVRNRGAVMAAIATGVLSLLVLDILSVRQVRTWRDDVSVCENTVRVSPNNASARCALADSLAAYDQYDRAMQTYQEAIRLDPDCAMPLVNFGWLLATCPDERLRDYDRAIVLAERGCEQDAGHDPTFRRSLTIVYCAYAEELTRRQQFRQAAAYYRKALAVDPDCQRASLELDSLLPLDNDTQ